MKAKWVREAIDSPWTIGDVIAALIVILFVGFVALSLLMLACDALVRLTAYGWHVAGGTSGDDTQESMARAAWAGVVVGVITIVLLGFTLAYTSISTNIALLATQQTRLFGNEQLRAYVSLAEVTVTTAPWRHPRFWHTAPTIMAVLKNTGQTPARDVKIRFGWQNFPPEAPAAIVLNEPHSSHEIGAGLMVEERIPSGNFVESELSSAVYADAPSWIIGVVEYQDVFGGKWKTHFVREIRLAAEGNDLTISIIVPPSGNFST